MPNISSQDRKNFERYCETAFRLYELPAAKKLVVNNRTHLHYAMSGHLTPELTPDEFRSYLIDWRKLFVNNDATSFGSILNRVAANFGDEGKEWNRILREEFSTFNRTRPIKINYKQADGTEYDLTFDAIKALISPYIFHDATDNESRERFFRLISKDGSLRPDALYIFLMPAVLLMIHAQRIAEYIQQELKASKQA